MPLTCSCDFDSEYDWYYISPNDYTVFSGKRRKRRTSCRELINFDESVASFSCYRPARDEIEERIYGEDGEIDIADKILCEKCSDIYFSLRELGFECISPKENMYELAKEHRNTYSQRPR